MLEESALVAGLKTHFPIDPKPYSLEDRAVGLVIIDEVNGFCTVGAGAMAPSVPDAQVAQMVEESDRLARRFAAEKRPILAFLDTHEPGRPEPPYPPHCERGSGEENLVPALAWLEDCNGATLIRKDCVNGYVGAIEASYVGGVHGQHHNKAVDWINNHRLQAVITAGICTDGGVMDFVLTLLSARNHGMTPTLQEIVVCEPATATRPLPLEGARSLGRPTSAAHPTAAAHHMGLYFMAARGALLASELT